MLSVINNLREGRELAHDRGRPSLRLQMRAVQFADCKWLNYILRLNNSAKVTICLHAIRPRTSPPISTYVSKDSFRAQAECLLPTLKILRTRPSRSLIFLCQAERCTEGPGNLVSADSHTSEEATSKQLRKSHVFAKAVEGRRIFLPPRPASKIAQ